VQRLGDLILKDLPFAQVYINDFIVFLNLLEEHIKHLNCFFERLVSLNFILLLKKAYLAFPSIKLLEKKVNSYSYSTTKKQLQAL